MEKNNEPVPGPNPSEIEPDRESVSLHERVRDLEIAVHEMQKEIGMTTGKVDSANKKKH